MLGAHCRFWEAANSTGDPTHFQSIWQKICGKVEDNLTALAESHLVRLEAAMEWDSASTIGADIAATIADLQTEELYRFFRDHIRRRNLHEVVANLNEAALSKDNPRSENARNALKRLGFPD